MSEIAVYLIFGVGSLVCLAGGVGIAAIVVIWGVDKLLVATGNMNIVAQWWLAKKMPHRFKG